jgi:hypothetical protein
MKDRKKVTTAIEDKQNIPEQQVKKEDLSANAEEKSIAQNVNGKLMSTHAFLRILSTVRKR